MTDQISFSPPQDGCWVFGYGSLMWRPGFDFVERRPARAHGYHRSFCVYSHVHRGTRDRPGLVFGLDRGGSCRGLAYRVRPEDWDQVCAYLRAREQVTMIYREMQLQVQLLDAPGARVRALTFVVDRAHEQYAGRLAFETQVRLIAAGEGQSGDNPDYLRNMVAHLEDMGIEDHELSRLWHAVAAELGTGCTK